MMKFVYFAPGDIQVARVDRQCIVYFCEAIHYLGVDIKLITLKIRLMDVEVNVENPLNLYRLKAHPPLRMVPTLLHQESNAVWWAVNRIVAHVWEGLRELVLRDKRQPLVFYTKNYGSAFAFWLMRCVFKNAPVILFEAHVMPSGFFSNLVLAKSDVIVANTEALARDLATILPRKKIIPTHQGVNLESYDELRVSKLEARETIGLPLNKSLAIYTGKIYWGYEEVSHLLEMARHLASSIELIMVGGRADHVERYQKYVIEQGISNVRFVGFVPPNKVQLYQLAADILLLYYPSGFALNRYRSPGKLFEYMAAGRPIVAADYPVLHEVVEDGKTAVFVPADSPYLLAKAIENLLNDPDKMENLSQQTLKCVKNFSWTARAKRILSGVISTCLPH